MVRGRGWGWAAFAGAAALIALGCSSGGEHDSVPLPPDELPHDVDTQDPPSEPQSSSVLPPIGAPSSEPDPPRVEPRDPGLLSTLCGACHGTAQSGNCAAGICLADVSPADLIAAGLIVPGDPDGSPLYVSMASGQMPPPGVFQRPSELELDQVYDFILRVRPPIVRCDNPPLSWDDVYQAIEADLLSRPEADRPFVRYLSLADRYGAGACAGELDVARAAMSKLINSISRRAAIQPPTPVSDALGSGTLYSIDLRDYGLDAGSGPVVVSGATFEDGWEAMIANNDYAVELAGEDADAAILLSETPVPVMFVDALIARASVGELYYGLLRLGQTQAEVLASLGVDRQVGLEQGSSVLAGATSSPIASGERLVVRNEQSTPGLYYYESFDLPPRSGAGLGVLEDPLGFSAGDEEGSQALFSLPNGLLGYVAFDASGRRLADAPTLLDPEGLEPQVRVGVSCMRCHDGGLVAFADQVREHALANEAEVTQATEAAGFTFADVLALYPPSDQLQRILDDDSAPYRAALSAAGAPLNGTEPISRELIRFDADVDRFDVAGALLYPLADFDAVTNQLDPVMSGLDNGFRMDRDDFDALYVSSLCAITTSGVNRPTAEACSAPNAF
jgi:hypothetical protein